MTLRHIDDLLKHGDADLNLPRPGARPKGPDARLATRALVGDDIRTQGPDGGEAARAVREWLAHVEEGRIGRVRH